MRSIFVVNLNHLEDVGYFWPTLKPILAVNSWSRVSKSTLGLGLGKMSKLHLVGFRLRTGGDSSRRRRHCLTGSWRRTSSCCRWLWTPPSRHCWLDLRKVSRWILKKSQLMYMYVKYNLQYRMAFLEVAKDFHGSRSQWFETSEVTIYFSSSHSIRSLWTDKKW